MRVFIEDSFDSAHWLPLVPVAHKCHNMHGHTYRIRIDIGGEIHKRLGWIEDYSIIKAKWEAVKLLLDHKTINDVVPNSTCENLAEWIWAALYAAGLNNVERLELRETATCGVVIDREP
jgi:6-pyruvoyltetrahydropterin/6-carboxytetrahydropterin synthase